jgi:hypothetical protein
MFDSIRIKRRTGPLALLVALGTLGFGTATANANQGDTTTCQFGGLTGALVPAIPAAAAKGQDGTYTFTNGATTVTCISIDTPEDPGNVFDVTAAGGITGPYNVDITSSGYYTNLQLGTGSVAGTARVGVAAVPSVIPPPPNDVASGGPGGVPPANDFYPPAANANKYTTVGFGIDFKNTVGVLGGGAVGPGDDADAAPHGLDASNVAGVVVITPNPFPPVFPVAGFTVTGAFTTT